MYGSHVDRSTSGSASLTGCSDGSFTVLARSSNTASLTDRYGVTCAAYQVSNDRTCWSLLRQNTLTGCDPSGGYSRTEFLVGLHRRPSVLTAWVRNAFNVAWKPRMSPRSIRCGSGVSSLCWTTTTCGVPSWSCGCGAPLFLPGQSWSDRKST